MKGKKPELTREQYNEIVDLRKALEAFGKAAWALETAWDVVLSDKATRFKDLADQYPFDKDFEEICRAIDDWRVTHFPPPGSRPYRKGIFALDWMADPAELNDPDRQIKGYTNDVTWNGWQCPVFDVDAMDSMITNEHFACWRTRMYDAMTDTYVFHNEPYSYDQVHDFAVNEEAYWELPGSFHQSLTVAKGFMITVDGVEEKVYALGYQFWCWMDVEQELDDAETERMSEQAAADLMRSMQKEAPDAETP